MSKKKHGIHNHCIRAKHHGISSYFSHLHHRINRISKLTGKPICYSNKVRKRGGNTSKPTNLSNNSHHSNAINNALGNFLSFTDGCTSTVLSLSGLNNMTGDCLISGFTKSKTDPTFGDKIFFNVYDPTNVAISNTPNAVCFC